LNARQLLGRRVRGELTAEACERLGAEVKAAEAAPLVRKFARWLLEGVDAQTCRERHVTPTGEHHLMSTISWYRARGRALLNSLVQGREEEFGLQNAWVEIEEDLTTAQLADLMGVQSCTLRGKMSKAQELGLPMPVAQMGRTLSKSRYIFPRETAQAWLEAYLEGRL